MSEDRGHKGGGGRGIKGGGRIGWDDLRLFTSFNIQQVAIDSVRSQKIIASLFFIYFFKTTECLKLERSNCQKKTVGHLSLDFDFLVLYSITLITRRSDLQ